MNILIYDPSAVPDPRYHQRIGNLFRDIAHCTIKFVTGILEATWQARHFRPDVIVFDWVCDCTQLRKLIEALHRITPSVAMFHLDGSGLILPERQLGLVGEPAVPVWLKDIASHWVIERNRQRRGQGSRDLLPGRLNDHGERRRNVDWHL
jgi:hypothetical protein